MRSNKVLIGLNTIAALFAVTLFSASIAVSQERLIYSFSGTNGTNPGAGLVFDASGNLYGTTSNGGAHNNGTVFELTPTTRGRWTEMVLYSFSFKYGGHPDSNLVFDVAGNLYGTAADGGTNGLDGGTAFQLMPAAGGGWTETTLVDFNGGDGSIPGGSVILDASGNLYGTTTRGGDSSYCILTYPGCGTVFELTPTTGGSWMESTYSFQGGSGGTYPTAGVVSDAQGNLYGTTEFGGTSTNCSLGCGTVFELMPVAGGGWTEAVLYSFTNRTDGGVPYGGVIFDASGNLYGTAGQGGVYTYGAVFELMPSAGGAWTETTLHSFEPNGEDGAVPSGGLVFDASGDLYGTTQGGGSHGGGTVFELKRGRDGLWTEKVRHNFSSSDGDGYYPVANLIFDASGNLYGTTVNGGAHNGGTVFEITP